MLYQTKNPHGGDIYGQALRLDYSANTNPFGTAPGVLTAVTAVLPELHHYPDPYCRKLTEAIAAFEGVPEDYVLCGNGAAELIYSYCEALRPQRAAELAPTFSEYALGMERVDCEPCAYRLRREDDFALTEAVLPWLREQKPEVLFLCSPNNPTGKLIPRDLLEKILRCCEEMGSRLFVDECFLDLSEGGISMKGFLAEHPGLFLLKAFTKSYGMAGLRLGYCLCSDAALLQNMCRTVQPWNVSTPAQAAGIAALKEKEFLAKTRALLQEERPWLKRKLEELGFFVCDSRANYLLFYGPERLDRALKARGIAIRNCDNYRGLGPGWYRIAVRLREENEELIRAVKACL